MERSTIRNTDRKPARKVRRKFDLEKFNENPIEEMLRLRPDTEPSFTALDYLKDQNSVNLFVKKYEEHIGERLSKEEKEVLGTPEHVAHQNIGYYLAWRQDTGPKLEMWEKAMNQTEQAY